MFSVLKTEALIFQSDGRGDFEMNNIKKIISASLIAYIIISLNTGCETPISQIVPYSGNWRFIFTYTDGNAFADSYITIQDSGAFCGKLTVSGSGTVVYIQGDVSGSGQITGGFANDCSGSVRGSFTGSFTEIMGAGFASGTFSDTIKNPLYKGTWIARRN